MFSVFLQLEPNMSAVSGKEVVYFLLYEASQVSLMYEVRRAHFQKGTRKNSVLRAQGLRALRLGESEERIWIVEDTTQYHNYSITSQAELVIKDYSTSDQACPQARSTLYYSGKKTWRTMSIQAESIVIVIWAYDP